MSTVFVTLTYEGRKYLEHNGGFSEIGAPDEIILEQNGSLRFEWKQADGSDLVPKETLVYANGMWACYTIDHE